MAQPVLLIEDDSDIRLLAEMTLRMNGIEVVACAEGQEGLDALDASEYSLVILDVMMPDMSGYEVLSRIAERFGATAPPVALFTARPQDATEKELNGHRVVRILPKPFDPEKLAQTVQELIRENRA